MKNRFPTMHLLCYGSVMSMALAMLCGCGGSGGGGESSGHDTLRVVTLYGPTSYFNYRGQQMGFDYENVRRFAREEGYVLDINVVSSLQALLNSLKDGTSQLAAYPVPYIEEYNSGLTHCGVRDITWQVLVQPSGEESIADVTELVGKTVYVEKDSKYDFRLRNLNEELGGGIRIVPIDRDSLITEDLIEMVESGEIPLTVIDSDIAELNHSYYPDLDISVKISLDQYSSWAVANGLDSLAEKVNRWSKKRENSDIIKNIYRKYFEISKVAAPYEDPVTAFGLKPGKGGRISPYDASFKRYADKNGIDWLLLAAIGFNESRFDNDIVSWAGAIGVMQLMPPTAKAQGFEGANLSDPDTNIKIAARLLASLDDALREKVPDKEERRLFVIAAYNCGLGHVYDAISLAGKYGLDPTRWTGNVSEAVLMKSRPRFFNDPVVRNGYFRGRETTEFVEKVLSVYNFFKQNSGAKASPGI